MASSNLTSTPAYTASVDQRFFVEPLGGPESPQSYLDRFPEELYSKSPDSHLVKLLYSLLGPAGIGWLRKNYLEARLLVEDMGIETFDLDGFFGNPLAFGRILEEIYDQDPNGLLPIDKWEEIRAKDARYRNRAIDFVNGARAGGTPEGLRLVARAGLGHEVEIVENYKHLYDAHSDAPIGVPYFGKTLSTEEFIVLPRRELPQGEVQVLTVVGALDGDFTLTYNQGTTSAIAWDATRYSIQLLLEALPEIGQGQVDVSGGPLPDTPIKIRFTGKLANRDVHRLYVTPNFGTGPSAYITVERNGVNSTDEVVYISDREKQHLSSALGRIRPVSSLVTYQESSGIQNRQTWQSVASGSAYREVIRYVSGNANVLWPTRDFSTNWIEKGVEHQSRKVAGDLQYHYTGFHNVASVVAYTEEALDDPDYLTDNWPSVQISYTNSHGGTFTQYQQTLFTYLDQINLRRALTPDMILADYHEPLFITTQQEITSGANVTLVNGIYSADWSALPNVPALRYTNEQFWASRERAEGTDYIELDLGRPQAVNYLTFDISNKPFSIEVAYDVLDDGPRREFVDVTLDEEMNSLTNVGYDATVLSPWTNGEIHFTDSLGRIIFTRYLRIKLSRLPSVTSPFITPNGTIEHSIEVKNLRVGRNLA